MNFFIKTVLESLETSCCFRKPIMPVEAGRTEMTTWHHGATFHWHNGLLIILSTPTQGCLCTKEIWRMQIKEPSAISSNWWMRRVPYANGAIAVIETDDGKSEHWRYLPYINAGSK